MTFSQKPTDADDIFIIINELENKGLSSPIFFFTYSHGSSVGNYHFVLRAPDYVRTEACSPENLHLVEEIKSQIPVFHTKAMKQQFYDLYGRITPKSKSYILRSIYRSLTGDQSAARTTNEEEIDNRVAEALSVETLTLLLISVNEIRIRVIDSVSSGRNVLTSCPHVHQYTKEGMTRLPLWPKPYPCVI